eukprot:4325891-Prymnesium_polylepis.1
MRSKLEFGGGADRLSSPEDEDDVTSAAKPRLVALPIAESAAAAFAGASGPGEELTLTFGSLLCIQRSAP